MNDCCKNHISHDDQEDTCEEQLSIQFFNHTNFNSLSLNPNSRVHPMHFAKFAKNYIHKSKKTAEKDEINFAMLIETSSIDKGETLPLFQGFQKKIQYLL